MNSLMFLPAILLASSADSRRPIGGRLALMLLLLLLLVVLFDGLGQVRGVVVDGHRTKELQATRKQSNARSMLDETNASTCGISDQNYDEHEFVSMAREGQFPWMVSFQITTLNNSSKEARDKLASTAASKLTSSGSSSSSSKKVIDLHFCCGAFVADKWILSAAHCFASDTMQKYLAADKLKAVAGSHKVSSRYPANRNLSIARVYSHSSYQSKTAPVGFDIALVELQRPVRFSQKRVTGGPMDEQVEPFMNSICLPLREKKYATNETARIAGWGMSSPKDERSMPSKLLTTDILIKDKQECVRQYSEALHSEAPKRQSDRYDDFICASYKNTRDACQSDSGAPLMEYASGKAVVIGIVSYGIGCATEAVPGLYTRTSAYTNWIKDIMRHGKEASVPFKLMEAAQTIASEPMSSSTTKAPNKFKFFDQVQLRAESAGREG